MDMVLITTSCGSRAEAERIALALVEGRLAACVQVVPATSIYRWREMVEQTSEHVLHIKTRAAMADRVGQLVAALHSYDVPELLILPVSGGSGEYLAWLATATATAKEEGPPPMG